MNDIFSKTNHDLSQPFLAQCDQLDQEPEDVSYTFQVLLEVVGTDDCQVAYDDLAQRTMLDLSDRQLTNLSPLTAFPQVKTLRLSHNQISDLQPLAHLTQLQELYLFDNEVVDLTPISSLINLQTLYLDNNRIQDLSPISSLDSLTILYGNSNRIASLQPIGNLENLEEIYVANNRIDDVDILRSLTHLTHLDLGNNHLRQVSPLSRLTNLIELDISQNQISTINTLSPLPNLAVLNLQNNPLTQKSCPIFPATVCLFSDDATELYQLGLEQLEQGDWPTALATFQVALQVYQTNGDRLRQSDALDQMGTAYDALGEYANAFDVYQQSAIIRQAVGDRQGESETLTNLGITYIRIGQFDQAITHLTQAWTLYQELGRGDRSWLRPEPRAGVILSNLALAYGKVENYPQSLQFAKQSLAQYRRGRDQHGEAIALNRVGQAYLALGNLDKAQLYLEKAQRLTHEQQDLPGLAQSLQSLGDLAAQAGQTAIALQRYQQAQTLWHQLQQPAEEGSSLNAIGKLWLDTAQPENAIAALESVVTLWESLRPGLTDQDKISIVDIQTNTYNLLQKALVAVDQPEAALEVSERGRARAFAELLAHRLSLRVHDSSHPSISRPSISRPSISHSDSVHSDSVHSSAATHPTTAPLSNLAEPPTIEQIRSIAQTQNATLVEYSLVGDALYIWVVQPTGMIHFRQQSLHSQPIGEKIQANRLALGVPGRGFAIEAIGDPLPSPETPLYELYQLLIEPIAALLPPNPDSPVIIIPQRELFLVPFAALPDTPSSNSSTLIDHHALLFAPAISLVNHRNGPPLVPIGQVPALVVGNPTMPRDPATGTPLSSLPGAEREAQAIAPLLDTTTLTGDHATKAAVLNQLEEAAIAHFATHGLLDDFGTDIPGALALAPTEEDGGFLTAAEIAELPLSAQLVVLSACDTGRGAITGDGVVGLSRAFLTAGVDQVVVSLWSVNDDSTATLMTEFYRQLQAGETGAIALRHAMISTRTQYSHPSDWAAFTLFSQTVQ